MKNRTREILHIRICLFAFRLPDWIGKSCPIAIWEESHGMVLAGKH
jgi:hypothetical protein